MQKSGKKIVMMIILLGSLLATLAGCGSSSSGLYTESVATTADSGAGFRAGASADYASAEQAAVKGEAENPEETQIQDGSRKLIKTVHMRVETREYDDLLDRLQTRVNELGGYIESMNTYNGSMYSTNKDTRSADLAIRIPVGELESFLEEVSGISNVISRSDTVEDITLAYVDLESHKSALHTEQTRLLELLEQAESIEDIIAIEERLSNVRYQLETMESQLRTYDNQVDYSTVYLDISEVEVLTPVEKESAWSRIANGFVRSVGDVCNGLVEFGIWFLIHIPYLLIWAAIITAVILIMRRAKGRRRKKRENAAPNQPAEKQEK